MLAAVRPFLSVARTTVAVGTSQNPDVYRVGMHVLPDDPRTVSQLDSAVNAVRWILDKIDLASPEVQPVLREIATLSRELRVDVQYDTAMGGFALAVVAPAEVAELLIERTLADLPQVIRWSGTDCWLIWTSRSGRRSRRRSG